MLFSSESTYLSAPLTLLLRNASVRTIRCCFSLCKVYTKPVKISTHKRYIDTKLVYNITIMKELEVHMTKLIIIGDGPAGASAALYALRGNIDTTVISKGYGALEKAHAIENY